MPCTREDVLRVFDVGEMEILLLKKQLDISPSISNYFWLKKYFFTSLPDGFDWRNISSTKPFRQCLVFVEFQACVTLFFVYLKVLSQVVFFAKVLPTSLPFSSNLLFSLWKSMYFNFVLVFCKPFCLASRV